MFKITRLKIAVYSIIYLLIANSNITFIMAAANSGILAKLKKQITTHGNYSMPKGLSNSSLLNLDASNAPSSTVFNSAFQIGGSAVTQIGGTARDSDGNYFVTGGFTGEINIAGTTLLSSSGYDFFIAKLDSSGNILWARVAKGALNILENLAIEGGIAITVDANGDCYVGGAFVKTMSFMDETGNIVAELTDGRNDNDINFEVFVAKYSSNGNLLWARGGNSGSEGNISNLGSGINTITCLILDHEGYPYVGGRYSGTNFLDETLTPKGKGEFFVASLDPENGDPYWISLTGTSEDDLALSLSVDNLGYINVLGQIGIGEITLPDTSLTYNNETGSSDTFIISYDINGEWYFASIIGGGEDIVGNDIASDEIGNIYVTGEFSGTASFAGSDIILVSSGSSKEGYITKYDLNGNALWVRQFGGYAYTKGNRIVTDEMSNSYVVGVFNNQATFGKESNNPVTLSSNSSTDMFVVKYDSVGNFQWVKQIDGSGTEGLDLIASASVPVTTNPIQLLHSRNKNGELVISGDFNNSLFLDDITLNAGENSRFGFVSSLNISDGATGILTEPRLLGNEFILNQNYPNPFNPSTTMNFTLPKESEVTIDIFNSLGQKVETLVNQKLSSGSHIVQWDASSLASGIYLYTLRTNKFTETKKMTLLK